MTSESDQVTRITDRDLVDKVTEENIEVTSQHRTCWCAGCDVLHFFVSLACGGGIASAVACVWARQAERVQGALTLALRFAATRFALFFVTHLLETCSCFAQTQTRAEHVLTQAQL